MFGPIILFWYVDWYWIVGYYNLYFTYTSYVLYKGYDNNPKYRKKYPLFVVIILPLLLGFIGLIISVVNGFEEIREGDKDFNKNQSKTKNQKVSDKTKDKIKMKQGDEKIEYFPSGEIKTIIGLGFIDISGFLEDMLKIEENIELRKDYDSCTKISKILLKI